MQWRRLPFVEAAWLIHHHRIDDGLGVHAQPALCLALQVDRGLADFRGRFAVAG